MNTQRQNCHRTSTSSPPGVASSSAEYIRQTSRQHTPVVGFFCQEPLPHLPWQTATRTSLGTLRANVATNHLYALRLLAPLTLSNPFLPGTAGSSGAKECRSRFQGYRYVDGLDEAAITHMPKSGLGFDYRLILDLSTPCSQDINPN